jgi:hypothetical protein
MDYNSISSPLVLFHCQWVKNETNNRGVSTYRQDDVNFTCQNLAIIAFDFDDRSISPIVLNNFILNNNFEILTFNSIFVILTVTLCACNLSINVYKNNVG